MLEDASVGEYAVDRHDSSPDLAVVVNRPGVTCANWDTKGGESTVAKDNPICDPDGEVIVVVFENTIESSNLPFDFSEGDIPLQTLADNSIPYFAFPRERLTSPPDELVQESITPTEELEQIITKLDESGITYRVEDENTVVCEKLGSEYEIQPGGLVSGTGVLASQLDSLAKEVV